MDVNRRHFGTFLAGAVGSFAAGPRAASNRQASAPVTRAAWVKVEARGVDGQPITINARGLRARVLQHEIDHLDGVLFIDRVDPMVRDRIKRKIKKEGLREDASRHAFAL